MWMTARSRLRVACRLGALVASVWVSLSEPIAACPFCSVIGNTLSGQLREADVAVVATRLGPASRVPSPPGDLVPHAYQVDRVLRGVSPTPGHPIVVQHSPTPPPAETCLLFGFHEPEAGVSWTAPMPVSQETLSYLEVVDQLPLEGPQRLRRLIEYLEHPEAVVSNDAYDEFARAPYLDVKRMREHLDPSWLLARIRDSSTTLHRRRLYYTLLGVTGGREHAEWIEHQIAADTGRSPPEQALDAALASYLMLAGEAGLANVERWYLRNPESTPAEVFAVIAALRFHGTEEKRISRNRITAALRLVVDRLDMADLVLPDLARWGDWSILDRLPGLYEAARENRSYVRVPIINYLRVCPLPQAKAHLETLTKNDPEAIRRAELLMPFPARPPLREDRPPATNDPRMARVTGASSSLAAASAFVFPTPAEDQHGNTRSATRGLLAVPIMMVAAFLVLAFILIDPMKRGAEPTPLSGQAGTRITRLLTRLQLPEV